MGPYNISSVGADGIKLVMSLYRLCMLTCSIDVLRWVGNFLVDRCIFRFLLALFCTNLSGEGRMKLCVAGENCSSLAFINVVGHLCDEDFCFYWRTAKMAFINE